MSSIRPSRGTALVAAAALCLVAAVAVAAQARHAREDLVNAGATDTPDARGRLTVKDYAAVGNRPARSWVRLQCWKLERGVDVTMFVDDPTVEGEDYQPWGDTITPRGNGNVNTRLDTKGGATLPFGKTADELAGALFQLRDSEGTVVLTGVFPTLPAVQVEE